MSSTPPIPAPDDLAQTYAWLLAPFSTTEFERSYYQKAVCVIRRDSPRYYQGLLSVTDLDRILATHWIRHPDFQIVQLEKEIPPADYTNAEGVVDPLRATKLFADGATFVFDHLHTRLPVLAGLCTALSQAFSSKMQTNIYLTPVGAQGFKPHWDTHDVFVLQVAGSKLWTIYDTKITLPLRGQKFDPKRDVAGEPTLEFELRAGDAAYIPRGAMHSARSTAEFSLHVTTGLMAFTWADLFLQGVASLALEEESLRENLPLGFARSLPAPEKARLLGDRLARIGRYLEAHPPFDYFSDELISHNRPCFLNQLSQVSRLPGLTLASRVRRRPDAIWDVHESDANCTIKCYGNRLDLPRFLAPALQFMKRREAFSIAEIPDCVDGNGKLTLVKRLVREGLLECVDPGD